MDYYEELGISSTATEEEIRKAHRRLTKLLHPDQQTDEGMKVLAETQMRRLNSIVETLSDPERRKVYDEQLREGLIPFGPVPMNLRGPPPRRRLHSLPWWMASTVAAVLLTVGAVWFWANDWGSSFASRTPTYIPSEATASTPPSSTPPSSTGPASSTSSNPAPAAAADATRVPVPPTPASPSTTVQVEKHQSAFSRIRDAVLPRREVKTPKRAASLGNSEAERQTARAGTPPAREMASNLDSRTVSNVPAFGESNTSFSTMPSSAPETSRGARSVPRRKTLHLANTNVSARARSVNMDLPPPPSVPAIPTTHVDTAGVPMATLPMLAAQPPASPSPARVTAMTASAAAAPTKSARQNPLEGEWVYAPTEPEKKRPGFYPPEFIDLKLSGNSGGLRGQYRARYNVTDKPIPPDVSFTLSQNGNNKFLWQGSNGSRGTLQVTSVDGTSIHIEWKTTVFSHGLALTAGTATLVRRAP